jgi:hypothetical protein
MKIRSAFVSNSSSSSFLCRVCGNIEEGFDVSVSEVGMCECEDGHIFCDGHKLDIDTEINSVSIAEMKEFLLSENEITLDDNFSDEDIKAIYHECQEEDINEVSTLACPICQLKSITNEDMKAFLFKKLNSTEKLITKEIISTFADYDSFQEFLSKK